MRFKYTEEAAACPFGFSGQGRLGIQLAHAADNGAHVEVRIDLVCVIASRSPSFAKTLVNARTFSWCVVEDAQLLTGQLGNVCIDL
jgi:hypothetical protein